jgi:translation initiation factor IF-2
MSSITVAQFAIELKMPSNVLLEQLREAGVNLTSVDASVTDSDKAKLLESLRRSHGATEGTKITLTRRKTSEIRQADGAGRSRTIQVEVRKKRTFVKRDVTETGELPAAEGAETEALVQAPATSASQLTSDVVVPEAVVAPTEQVASQSGVEAQTSEATAVVASVPEIQTIAATQDTSAATEPTLSPEVQAPVAASAPEAEPVTEQSATADVSPVVEATQAAEPVAQPDPEVTPATVATPEASA